MICTMIFGCWSAADMGSACACFPAWYAAAIDMRSGDLAARCVLSLGDMLTQISTTTFCGCC
jgi:hypothetical protein